LTLNTNPAYMPPLKGRDGEADERARKQGGLQAAKLDHWGKTLVDCGIRGKRQMIVDASGESGAPLLVAIHEQVRAKPSVDAEAQPAEFEWSLPLDNKDGELAVDGNRFTLTKGGASLQGIVVGADALGGDAAARVADGEVLVVFTLQQGEGEATQGRTEGTSGQPVVSVGGRTVQVRDGELQIAD
ncbi:MAG: hypothetical protein ACOC93_06720, partial [Planctomycetota bacterium]